MQEFDSPPHILILGGTGDANKITLNIKSNPNIKAAITLSLAGRTKSPNLPDCRVITGGFSGVEGLKNYLENQAISAVIDATHPFADKITNHAYQACEILHIPLCRFERAAWVQQPSDDWYFAENMDACVKVAPTLGKVILLTTGSKDLAKFMTMTKVKILARMVELPPDIKLAPFVAPLFARGPFDLDEERALLSTHKIDLIIAKNSGGEATSAKLIAARELKIPVLLVERPKLPPIYTVDSLDDVSNWLKNNL